MKNSVPIRTDLWTFVCYKLSGLTKLFPCSVDFVICSEVQTTGNAELQPMQKCLFIFKKKV